VTRSLGRATYLSVVPTRYLHTQVTNSLTDLGYTSARSVYPIEIKRKFNLIHEHEWTGNTLTGICKKYDVSRKTYYKWKNRYDNNGIDGLYDLSRVPRTIKYKTDTATEEIWLQQNKI